MRRAAIVIGLIALVVRVAALVATDDIQLTDDPTSYDLHARTIAATAHYPGSEVTPSGGPTALRAPGYTVFLGAVYAVTGDSVTAGRVAQAILGAAIAVLVALIAAELFGFRTGFVAGLLTAVFPPLVIDGLTLFTEPLFVVLELTAVLAVLLWRKRPRPAWLVLAGVAVGLAMLTRPNAFLILVVLAFAVRGAGPWRSARRWRPAALLLASALLVVAPWTIRNAVQFDAFVPVSTQDGYTLSGTYNETSRSRDALWIPQNPMSLGVLRRNPDLDEAELNAELRSEARRFALDHPLYVAEVGGRNLLRLFNLGGAAYEREVARRQYGLGTGWAALMTWSLFPILALALIGAFTPAARAAPRWVWLIPLLLLSTVFVLAANRHRAGIDPFLLILAALALERAWASRVARTPATG